MPLLHHERFADPTRPPQRWLLFLHGVFGSGRNWAHVARSVVERRPDWGSLLIDLREHGKSLGLPGPHTLRAAADDVRETVESLGLNAPAILGHSFGGKVAMEYASHHPPGLRQVFIADSTPDPVPDRGEGSRMLAILRGLPAEFATRDQAVEGMVSQGVAVPVAQWMSMNLERDGQALRWRMDLGVIDQLMKDFRVQNLWHALEPGGIEFHFLRATRSDVLTPHARHRLSTLGPHVTPHNIEAGHWLNADNPGAVASLLCDTLARKENPA